MRRTTYAAVILEGAALAQDVLDAAVRIHNAAAFGSRELILHEAGRLGYRAQAARAEFRRLAEGIES